MADDKFKILEERLTRIEAALTQRPGGTTGTFPPGGVVVDPAPWPGGPGGYYGGWRPRPWPWPHPIVDPAPWPMPIVDPAPWPNPVVDPAPHPGIFDRATLAATLGRIGHVGDPAPPDLSRLTLVQLEASLHSIASERARLDSLESMVKKQIEAVKRQG
jgi:hypothetical protein